MLGNKPPYTTMQQLNLDWVLSKLKTLLRLVPDDGAVGQILRRTRDGAVWSDEQGGGGGGAVQSVNGKTGAVVLDAVDVGALPDDYTPPVTSVNGQTGAVTVPVPVQSVNSKTGAVVLDALDIPTVDSASVQQHITQIEIDVSDLAAKQFGKSSRRHAGTTDAYGNIGIPKTVIDADKEFAVPLYATGGYLAGTAYDSGQIYAKIVRFDGSPLSNASVTVYFLV